MNLNRMTERALSILGILALMSILSCHAAPLSPAGATNPKEAPQENRPTYAELRASWDAVMLPWIEKLAGLTWNAKSRNWDTAPGWLPPTDGIGPNVYSLEQALRPATHMAIMKQDIPLMEELASFHLALLRQRSTTIGAIRENPTVPAIASIDDPSETRIFEWRERSGTQVRARDARLSTLQYISTAASLMRAIAELPNAKRTKPLSEFVENYHTFLVRDQIMRSLFSKAAIAYADDKRIPQPVVQAWIFLATTGYRAPHPYRYRSAMNDKELWLIADAAEVLGADAAAPELKILDAGTRVQLRRAVQAGVGLLERRCHHATSPDGADVLSVFAGDYEDYPDYAYAAVTTGPASPTVPAALTGVSWDISHSYRLPIVFRSLYETRNATGVRFPALNDLAALANTYVHLAFNGDFKLPAFNNFLDGSNGWYRVGYSTIPGGYPPYQYCHADQPHNNCLTTGAVQGWGQLAFANSDLAALVQSMIDLAYDNSASDQPFKDQHYYYEGHYSVHAGQYPWLMIYLLGDDAERLP